MATIAAENFTQPTFHGEAHGEAMDWAISAQVLLTCIAGFLVWHVLKYSRIKGPIVWPVVGTTPQFLWNLPRMHDWTTDMLVKHDGTYTSIAPKCTCLTAVATCRPENLEYVLKTNFANYPKGRSFTYPSHDLLGQGIFNTDHDLWKMQRKTASLEFSTRTLRDLMVKSNRSSVQQRLLPTLAEVANSREPIDFQDLFLRYTFDNICMVGFGVDPGCLAPGLPTVPFAQAFDLATEGTLTRMVVPEIFWRVTRYLGVGMEGRLAKAIGVIDKFAMDVITERRKELALLKLQNATDYPCDLLSRFMQSTDHAGLPYTDAFLRDVTTNFILAGRDTTAIALSWFFYLITQHPEVELNILEEINQIVQNRPPSPNPRESEETTKKEDTSTKTTDKATKTENDAPEKEEKATDVERATEEEQRATADDRATEEVDRATESGDRATAATEGASSTIKASLPTKTSPSPTETAGKASEKASSSTAAKFRSLGFEELKQLHYLHAALSESMRLYPSVPIDNKDVTADDFLPDGTFVRKGTRLMYSIYSMGRMESVWGKDCLQFRPERWLRNGVFTPESPFRYTVFNAGPRLCLGKELAYLQMKSVASAILRNYHVRLVAGHKVEYKLSLTLFMKYGLRVTLHPRVNAAC